MFVLVRNEDGKYVAPPGRAHSYTGRLEQAQTFATREAADANRCGNESIRDVCEIMGKNF